MCFVNEDIRATAGRGACRLIPKPVETDSLGLSKVGFFLIHHRKLEEVCDVGSDQGSG